MKAIVFAAAAALAGSVVASPGHHHAHDIFHQRRQLNDSDICTPGCTTVYSTIWGEATWTPTPFVNSSTATSTYSATSTGPVTVPTPIAKTCSTPGSYTFPATIVTLTETKTVCAASTTTVSSGTHTLGGVTTTVTSATTVTVPYATTTTSSGVVTSVVLSTIYVCPSAGTYTIAPTTVTVTDTETVVAVPVVTSYVPGTYTAPAVITTVTEVDVTVWVSFNIPPQTTTTTKSTTTTVATTTTSAKPATTTTSAATSTSKASSGSNSGSSSGSNSGSGGSYTLGHSGDQWAVTYVAYTSSGGCKSASQVKSDVQGMAAAGFQVVRVYSTDCDTLPNVGSAARAAGMKMIVGIFIGEAGCHNASPDVEEQISAIVAWKQWDLVEAVIAGNEAMFNGYCSAQQLVDLIGEARGAIAGAGYTGPFGTTDVVSSWLTADAKKLCSVIDFVASNIHPFFNGALLPSASGAFVAGQLALIEAVCPGKPGIVTESGWPTSGDCNGECCPGGSQQQEAVKSIQAAIGGRTALFTWTDDLWKQPGEFKVETSFGLSSLF